MYHQMSCARVDTITETYIDNEASSRSRWNTIDLSKMRRRARREIHSLADYGEKATMGNSSAISLD